MKRAAFVAASAAASVAIVACAPSAQHLYRDEGASLSFPVAPEVRRVREGPWADATVVSARHGGITYELARFVLTAIPDDAQRAALLAEVERGLSARRGVSGTEAADATFLGRPSRRLTVSFADGTAARFVVFFRDERTLVELSVFGPAGALDEVAGPFFASYSPVGSGSSPASSSATERSVPDATTQ